MRRVIYKEWIRGVETEEYKQWKKAGESRQAGESAAQPKIYAEGTNCYIEKEGLFHGFYADSNEGLNFTSIIELSDGSVVTAGVTMIKFIDSPESEQLADFAKAALACVPARFKDSNGYWKMRDASHIAEESIQIAYSIISGLKSLKP